MKQHIAQIKGQVSSRMVATPDEHKRCKDGNEAPERRKKLKQNLIDFDIPMIGNERKVQAYADSIAERKEVEKFPSFLTFIIKFKWEMANI
jgi:hypothetical protein